MPPESPAYLSVIKEYKHFFLFWKVHPAEVVVISHSWIWSRKLGNAQRSELGWAGVSECREGSSKGQQAVQEDEQSPARGEQVEPPSSFAAGAWPLLCFCRWEGCTEGRGILIYCCWRKTQTGLDCAVPSYQQSAAQSRRCEMRQGKVERAAQNFPQLQTTQHFLSLLMPHCLWFDFVLFQALSQGTRAQHQFRTMISAETKGGDTCLLWLSGNEWPFAQLHHKLHVGSFILCLLWTTWKTPLDSKPEKASATGQELEVRLGGRKLLGLVLKYFLQLLPSLPSFLYSHRY